MSMSLAMLTARLTRTLSTKILSPVRPSMLCRYYSNYEGDGKTTVTILNKELDSGILIDSYSQAGFRLNNGIFVVGPLAVFPKSVLSWNIADHEEINEESLSLFYMLEPKLDLLILGVGDYGNKIDRSLIEFLRSKRISVEILPTEKACATFNFLNSEKRCIAGGLVPPKIINVTDDDSVKTKALRRKLRDPDYEFW